MSSNELETRSRKWQITENNPDYTKRDAVERLCGIGQASYAISCEECGESGTRHIHAFVVFNNAIKGASIKKVFERAHIEPCRGSMRSNRDYITKSDQEPYEVGELPLVDYVKPENIASRVVAFMGKGETPLAIMTQYAECADYVIKHFRALNEIYEAMSREAKRRH